MKYITTSSFQKTIVYFLILAIDIWVDCFRCTINGRTPTYSRTTALYVQLPIITKAVPWAPRFEVARVFDILVNGSIQRKAAVLLHVIPLFLCYKAITSKFMQNIFKICYRYMSSLFETQKLKKPVDQTSKRKEALKLSFEKARLDQSIILKEIVKKDQKKNIILIEQKDPSREEAALIGKAKQSVQVILANIDEAKAKANTDSDVKLSYQLKETFKEEMRAIKIARELEVQRIEAIAVAEKQKRMDEFRKGQEGRRASLEENMKKKRDEKRESQVMEREKALQEEEEEVRNRGVKELEERQGLNEKETVKEAPMKGENREEQLELEGVEELSRINDLIQREEIMIEEDLEKIQDEIRMEETRAQEEVVRGIEEDRRKEEARIVEEERSRDEEERRGREAQRIQQEEDRLIALNKIKEEEQGMIRQRTTENEIAALDQILKKEAEEVLSKEKEEQKMIQQRTVDNERAALEQRLKGEALLREEEKRKEDIFREEKEQKLILQRTVEIERVALEQRVKEEALRLKEEAVLREQRLNEEALLREEEDPKVILQRIIHSERAALEQRLKEEAISKEGEKRKMEGAVLKEEEKRKEEATLKEKEKRKVDERLRLEIEETIKQIETITADKFVDETRLGKGGTKQRIKEENRIREVSRRKENGRMKVEEQMKVEAMSDADKKSYFEIQREKKEREAAKEQEQRADKSLHELAVELREEEEAIRLLGLKLAALATERANEESAPITIEAAIISHRNRTEAEDLKVAALKAFEMKERTEEEQRLLLLAEGVVVTDDRDDSMTEMPVLQPIINNLKASKSGLRSDSLVALFFTFALIAPIFLDLFKAKG